jgi:uncharacterized protein (DUF1800 family)
MERFKATRQLFQSWSRKNPSGVVSFSPRKSCLPCRCNFSTWSEKALAAVMCLSLTTPSTPALSQAAPSPPDQSLKHASGRQPYKSNQLQGDERILHALNRFTFGPRQGDLEAVRAMGLDKWFNQQLHPATLDQAELNARLDQFPAMQLDLETLLFRFPSNAIIRQVADGKAPIPKNPALMAIYDNQLARVEEKRQEKDKQNQQQASIVPNAAIAPMAAVSPQDMAEAMIQTTDQPAKTQAMGRGTVATMAPEPSQPSDSGQMNIMSAKASQDQQEFDQAKISRIIALPPQQRVGRLGSMQQTEFDSFRKALKPPQHAALIADLTPMQREFVDALENPQRVVVDELASQRLTRDIYSNTQLQEVMTDFWLNHFNVFLHKNEETPYYLVSYERDVIRPRALGKFEDLLEATAHSPAMLVYLDNSSSMGPDSPAAERNKIRDARNSDAKRKAPEGLNENYARELMELHTLGVNGGYTQADVTQVARILTGWTVDRPARAGEFKFDENRHEPGTKKVMGQKFKDHGELEGRQLLHMLATRPATAHFLSRKLAIRFVGDDPPQSLVDRMAKSYLSSGGDIPAVLNTLFHSPEFWAADAYRAKVKTPIEFIVSAVRAGNANADNMQPFVNALREMGMPLYGAIPPTGYNWQASTWVSTGSLVNRMNFALRLAANKLPGVAVTWPVQDPASTTPTPQSEEQRLESLLVAGGVSESTRAAVLDQFAQQNGPADASGRPVPAAAKQVSQAQNATALDRQDQLLAGLLLGSPEFQRR